MTAGKDKVPVQDKISLWFKVFSHLLWMAFLKIQSNQSRETEKVATVERWPFQTGSTTHILFSREPIYMATIDRWPV